MNQNTDPLEAMADALEDFFREWDAQYGRLNEATSGSIRLDMVKNTVEALRTAYRAQADEPQYRMLKRNDILQKGDEYCFRRGDEWQPVTKAIGCPILTDSQDCYRRPIPKEAR